MQVRFPQPDGRGVIPRKWTVAKDGGPLVFYVERLIKRLIAFGWPCGYSIPAHNYLWPRVILLEPAADTAEFRAALAVHLQAVSLDCAWQALVSNLSIRLAGDPHLVLRWGVGSDGRPRVVGAAIKPQPDVPF